jgi:hypothetical protein
MSIYQGYEPARSCTGSATPGCRALMSWFLGAYGHLGAVNSGIYNCRSIGGGGGFSLHAEGRACDLGIRPYSADWGSVLATQLWDNSAELGVQLVIWNRRYASGSRPDRGWMPYSGLSPHVDHIHAELSWHAARTLTVENIEKILGEKDDMAEVPQWQWDRLFNRVLRMSAGVPQENFNGEQFDLEQGKIDEIIRRLEQIEARLPKTP